MSSSPAPPGVLAQNLLHEIDPGIPTLESGADDGRAAGALARHGS